MDEKKMCCVEQTTSRRRSTQFLGSERQKKRVVCKISFDMSERFETFSIKMLKNDKRTDL